MLSDTQVEFKIRDGVTFHDGTTLTPEDVAFSVSRIIDPKLASPQLGQFDKIVKAEATGPHSVDADPRRRPIRPCWRSW